jgi:solute carrier family 25 phosphate transporter 23/24/25/41
MSADTESAAAVARTAAIPPKDVPSTNAHLRKRGEGMVAGGLAGAFAKTCTAPFERVKILCQTGVAATPAAAMRTVMSKEGARGYWKGNFASVIRIIPNRGVLFMCSDFFKDIFRYGSLHKHPSLEPGAKVPPLSGLQYVCAGSLSGAVTVITTYPLDLVRGRLTGTVGSHGRYRGIVQTLALTVREEGFRALYRGMGTSLVGAFPYEGIRFGVYDGLKAHYITDDSPIYMNVACGAASGLAAATVLYPNDTVRRRMQVQHKGRAAVAAAATVTSAATGTGAAATAAAAVAAAPTEGAGADARVYRSGIDCYRSLFREHGIRIFYRGLSANLARAAPSAALQFTAFELVKRAFADARAAAGAAAH